MSIDESQISERLALLEQKADHHTEQLSAMQVSLDKLTVGIGSRVEQHGEKLAVMEERMGVIRTVATWILAPVVGAIALGVLMLIMKAK